MGLYIVKNLNINVLTMFVGLIKTYECYVCALIKKRGCLTIKS